MNPEAEQFIIIISLRKSNQLQRYIQKLKINGRINLLIREESTGNGEEHFDVSTEQLQT